VIDAAAAAVAKGELEAYLARLAAHARTKNARDVVIAAWKATGISTAYDWRRSVPSHPEHNERDMDIAAINARMASAYQAVQDASFARHVDVIELDRLMTEALAVIAAAEADLKEYLRVAPLTN
jgi:hypothetical protein